MSSVLDILTLRLCGPMMSFGAPLTDSYGPTAEFPQTSMLVGMLANALGVTRREFDTLHALQGALRYAVRQDRPGRVEIDYQTVDLSLPSTSDCGWTTRHEVETRGGSNGEGTHVRRREYIADASYLIALTVAEVAGAPSLNELEAALRLPVRPLFLGRKHCLPTCPIFAGRVQATTLYAALETAPLDRYVRGDAARRPLRAWWSDGDGPPGGTSVHAYDRRDWKNNIHVGRRYLRAGTVTVTVGGPS